MLRPFLNADRQGAAGCAHCVERQDIVRIDILVDQALHDLMNLQAGQRQTSALWIVLSGELAAYDLASGLRQPPAGRAVCGWQGVSSTAQVGPACLGTSKHCARALH